MALRLGKKKDAPTEAPASAPGDDWSDAALLGQTDEPQPTIPAPSPAVAPVMAGATDPADDFVADTFAPAPRKKALSPVLLAGGLVLLLTALGVGAYFAFFSAPPEEEAPLAPPTRVVTAPVPPVAPKPPVVVRTKTTVTVKKVVPGKVVTPVTTTPKPVDWGKAGIASSGTKVPALRTGSGLPAVAPRPNMPAPVPLMQDGVAGQPGKGTSTGTSVQIVGSPVRRGTSTVASLPPTMQAQLKALWKQGADAKHERNYNGARRAWQKMLKLRPGHPGVQEAIEKLPRSR